MQDPVSFSRSAAMTRLMRAACAAGVTVQVWAMPAFAAPPEDVLVRTTPVSTHGIDLGSASGQALLRHRIERAAQKVCGAFDQPMAALSDDYIACHDRAVADASGTLQVMTARAGAQRTEMIADAGEAFR